MCHSHRTQALEHVYRQYHDRANVNRIQMGHLAEKRTRDLNDALEYQSKCEQALRSNGLARERNTRITALDKCYLCKKSVPPMYLQHTTKIALLCIESMAIATFSSRWATIANDLANANNPDSCARAILVDLALAAGGNASLCDNSTTQVRLAGEAAIQSLPDVKMTNALIKAADKSVQQHVQNAMKHHANVIASAVATANDLTSIINHFGDVLPSSVTNNLLHSASLEYAQLVAGAGALVEVPIELRKEVTYEKGIAEEFDYHGRVLCGNNISDCPRFCSGMFHEVCLRQAGQDWHLKGDGLDVGPPRVSFEEDVMVLEEDRDPYCHVCAEEESKSQRLLADVSQATDAVEDLQSLVSFIVKQIRDYDEQEDVVEGTPSSSTSGDNSGVSYDISRQQEPTCMSIFSFGSHLVKGTFPGYGNKQRTKQGTISGKAMIAKYEAELSSRYTDQQIKEKNASYLDAVLHIPRPMLKGENLTELQHPRGPHETFEKMKISCFGN